MNKEFEVQVFFRDGPLANRMAHLKTAASPGDIVRINGHDYRLLDGPALRVAMAEGVAHPNLSAAMQYVPRVELEALHA